MSTQNHTEGDDDADDVEYQLGAHPVDTSGVNLGENSEFLEWDMEVPTVFKRLADDIYSSTEAGVREPLTNAVTAIINAQRQYNLRDRGVVEFEVHDKDDGELVFIIRDNGTGIRESELREVLSVIGRSTARDDGDLAGQYGMGFLAVFKLVGVNSGFVMHTHHRDADEDPISGVWKSGGFSFDNEGVLPGRLEGDDYGTKFEFILKDEISKGEVREWVRENAEFARVPILYREFDANGNPDYKNEYGNKEFWEDYDDESPYIVVETDYYKAVMSPDSDSKTILLDVPVRRNHYGISDAPWKVDIQLKNENGVVIDGPHEGLMPVEDGEYENMDAARQEKYAPRGSLTSEDVILPGPTGTRDTLERQREFWDSHLGPKLLDAYETEVANVLETLSSSSDVFGLERRDFALVMDAVADLVSSGENSIPDDSDEEYTHYDLQDDLLTEFEVSVNDTVSETLLAAQREVFVLHSDHPTDDQPSHRDEQTYGSLPVWKARIHAKGDVYMGVSINQLRADVVWDDDEANRVVKVEESSHYAPLEQYLGWKKLRTVTSKTIDDFDISESLKTRFENEVGTRNKTSSEEETVTLHFDKNAGGSTRKSVSARKIRSEFDSYVEDGYVPRFGYSHRPHLLVLFTDSSDHNVSDYYWLGSHDIAVARCADNVAEYLTANDRIYTYDEFKEQANNTRLKTSDGWWNVRIATDSLVFHVLPENLVETFRDDSLIENVPTYIEMDSEASSYKWPRDMAEYNFVYTPVTSDELRLIRPVIHDSDAIVMHGDVSYSGPGQDVDIMCDTRPYALARLAPYIDDDESPELAFFQNVSVSLDAGGFEVVDALVEKYASA